MIHAISPKNPFLFNILQPINEYKNLLSYIANLITLKPTLSYTITLPKISFWSIPESTNVSDKTDKKSTETLFLWAFLFHYKIG